MRILFATRHSFPPQRVGGSERSTDALCRALAARGHEPAVWAQLEPGHPMTLLYRLRGRLPGAAPVMHDRRLGYPVYRSFGVNRSLAAVLSTVRPDVVVVDGSRPLPMVERFLAEGARVTLYLRDMEVANLGGVPPVDHPRLGFLANSRFTAACWQAHAGVRARVVPPLIERERYLCSRLQPETVTFFNPVPEKGLELALALAGRCSDLKFAIVEGWPLTPAQSAYLDRRLAGLRNARRLARRDDVRPLLARTRALLVPSLWREAWGRVVTEAQFNGIPVLASDRGALTETVGPGGLCLDPDLPLADWEAALRRLCAEGRERDGFVAGAQRHAARPELSPEEVVSAFEAGLRRD